MSASQIGILEIVFWCGVGVVFYAYMGYGIVLWLLLIAKRALFPAAQSNEERTVFPKVTFIVCAYNEFAWIAEKIANSLAIDYPSDKIRFVFVTDGSDDGTPQKALTAFRSANPSAAYYVLHQPERKGKIAAFHRAVTDFGRWEGANESHIIVSTDANTLLNKEAVKRMMAHFDDPGTGAVAGEKRIRMDEKDAANAAGEGIYWQYESLLKKWDAELWSVVGAAGELFALRADLYEPVPPDTIVEDFYLTMRIAQQGYRVAYEPGAYAVESSSASVGEEMKRKIRIAAGGLQAVARLAALLNIFRYGTLSFQYISHRFLRWTLAPAFLPVLLVSNIVLAYFGPSYYQIILVIQLLFYAFSALGYFFERRKVKVKAFFIPYYFCVMNYAMYAGLFRLLRGKQSVIWEKSERAS
jgi:cellulose synthase/poly-beta-1,6-N-acetylglucosamine synthase-like glycosyltransferase